MTQLDLDQEIGISTTIKHTKRDLADAIALLVNAHVIDMDECGRLADMIDSAYPSRRKSNLELAREEIGQVRAAPAGGRFADPEWL